jgi:hypothetical protein
MELRERHYHSERGDSPGTYQTLDVVQEEPNEYCDRQYIRFTLMADRWRNKREAAAYLRWAAGEIESLPG